MASQSAGSVNLRHAISTRLVEPAEGAEKVGGKVASLAGIGGGRPVGSVDVPRQLEPLAPCMSLDALVVGREFSVGEPEVRPNAHVVWAPSRVVGRESEQHVGGLIRPAWGQPMTWQGDGA